MKELTLLADSRAPLAFHLETSAACGTCPATTSRCLPCAMPG